MKSILKSIIVDDEKLAREDLKELLKEFVEIEVTGEAENVEEAKLLISELNPDLIFLDIQMPGKSGFELLEEMEIKTNVIFVTAYDEYAIQAFEVNAQDYLLKPVNKERLSLAVEHLMLDKKKFLGKQKKLSYEDNFFLMVNNSYQFVKVKNIVKISSAGNYTEIHTTSKQNGLVLKPLKEWEERLPDNYFVRIHRNSIINLNFVDHIAEWFNHSYQVYLIGLEKPLVMSRRYVSQLKQKLA